MKKTHQYYVIGITREMLLLPENHLLGMEMGQFNMVHLKGEDCLSVYLKPNQKRWVSSTHYN